MGIPRIDPGDIVRVNFNNSQFTLCYQAQVINIPSTPGESWIFLDLGTRETIYVSEGCTVTKIRGKI